MHFALGNFGRKKSNYQHRYPLVEEEGHKIRDDASLIVLEQFGKWVKLLKVHFSSLQVNRHLSFSYGSLELTDIRLLRTVPRTEPKRLQWMLF